MILSNSLGASRKSFLLIFFSVCFLCGLSKAGIEKVCIKDACVKVEVVDNGPEREQGLMFRESLAESAGMLFVFEEEQIHAFWMKNMHFPLDIIWLSADKKVVDIYQNALPCQETCSSIIPKAASKFVLEVPCGYVEKNTIKAGDSVEF